MMRAGLFAAMLGYIGTTASAELAVSEGIRTACTKLAEVAGQIMGARQMEVPMSVLLETVEGNARFESMVISAYEYPRRSTEAEKSETIAQFRDEKHLKCVAAAVAEAGRWVTHVDKDKMTGMSSAVLYTKSNEALVGSNGVEKVTLSWRCGEGFGLGSNLGFHTDNVSCPSGRKCRASQSMRAKFDDGEVATVRWSMATDNNEVAFILNDAVQDDFLTKAKAGKRLTLEVKAFNAGGRKQILTFSLLGFTAAYSEACRSTF